MSARPPLSSSAPFAGLPVAVAGDLICDHYVSCEPRGLSREAPVMVLRHVGERFGAGGAANVARNARALDARTALFGVLGRDAHGREVLELCESDGVDVSDVATLPGWTTPTKMRVVAAEPRRWPQQVLRIDREPPHPVGPAAREGVADALRARRGRVAALIVSDYGYGLVGAELGAAARDLARAGAVVVLDPRRHVEGFEGVSALTPNVGELALLTGRELAHLADEVELARAAAELLARTRVRWLLLTRGNLGMALWGEDVPPAGLFVEASGLGNVTDVSGAGDTSAAVFALALAKGLPAPEAMEWANAAAGVVVMENGTATCGSAALAEALAASPRPAPGGARRALGPGPRGLDAGSPRGAR